MIRAENYVTLEFLSRSSNEGFARVAAAGFAAQLDPTLDELGRIVLKLKLLPGNVLELTVRDWGRGIDNVEQARKPLFTTGGSERSGMGFTIMESFMDKLTVRSVPGKGTTVQMRKRIAARMSTGR